MIQLGNRLPAGRERAHPFLRVSCPTHLCGGVTTGHLGHAVECYSTDERTESADFARGPARSGERSRWQTGRRQAGEQGNGLYGVGQRHGHVPHPLVAGLVPHQRIGHREVVVNHHRHTEQPESIDDRLPVWTAPGHVLR